MTAPLATDRLDNLAQSLGYRSVFDFTRIQLRHAVEQKMAYYQSRIDYYQQKYGMDFIEFRRRVVDKTDSHLSKFGIIEKEDDDMEWELSIEMVQGYTDELQVLS
ncbi:hypothetical protein [Spirosoma rhododendri]|uniref:Uncharacterized protein n=1 Tax=Spirosoma rhododendri TaxID=2728024 RepID=A0A7L5DZ60_9BACT|nr:hypothetical protein [Spirosoma rhododendri]QJD80790.1 hypothetical protein HH216_21980 [Spirosoma rhododendri]